MSDSKPATLGETSPDRMTKDELYNAIIEEADLPNKKNTGSYSFRREHLVELLRHIRGDSSE